LVAPFPVGSAGAVAVQINFYAIEIPAVSAAGGRCGAVRGGGAHGRKRAYALRERDP